MNNEPVEWMCEKGFVYGLHETRPVHANIPLYRLDEKPQKQFKEN